MHYDSVREYEALFPHRRRNSLFLNAVVRHNDVEIARRTSTKRCSARRFVNVQWRCGRISVITFLLPVSYSVALHFGCH